MENKQGQVRFIGLIFFIAGLPTMILFYRNPVESIFWVISLMASCVLTVAGFMFLLLGEKLT